MTYRFYLAIGSSQTEVHPLNFLKTSLVDSQESGEIFYRRKFNGTLRFIGDDFDLIYMVEQVDPCTEIVLTIEQRDSGAATYHTYWEGYFSTTNGTFDLDNCTFDVTPKPFDDYKNFDLYGDKEYNILAVTPMVTTKTYVEDYTRNRFVIDVIEYLAAQIIPTVTVTSWFLNNAINPILNDANKYRYLTIAQKSDIKRPNSTNPATVGMMSFNQMMESLRAMYNLHWTYDGTTIRIEHYDFWTSTAGLDLRTQSIAARSNKYSYVKESMPKYEKWAFMEAEDTSYKEHTISYDSTCVDPKTTEAIAINVTTDLTYIHNCTMEIDGRNSSDISDEGWVILANYWDGADYRVYYGVGLGSANATYNYPNGWADLLRSFFMHGRVLLNGYIQETAQDFISSRKTKQQDIKAIVCYEDAYDPNDYITTELGETWLGGQKASVKQATIYHDGHVDFNLVYGVNRNTDVVLPERNKTIHVVVDEGSPVDIYIYLSEPNIYDTLFWILWNDGEVSEACQEITVPAGTVYKVEPSDLVGAFVSIKFNLTDASLTGWIVVYNENIPYADTIDCPAVPPPPPAVPSAPVINTPTQSGLCAELNVTWSSVGDATYYALYRKPDPEMYDDWGLIYAGNSTFYEDFKAGVLDGQTFYYKVQACNISGCSADSNTTSWDVLCM